MVLALVEVVVVAAIAVAVLKPERNALPESESHNRRDSRPDPALFP